jgi:hypothetical protein
LNGFNAFEKVAGAHCKMLGTLSGEACPLRILQRVGGSSFGFSGLANVWRKYVSNHAN